MKSVTLGSRKPWAVGRIVDGTFVAGEARVLVVPVIAASERAVNAANGLILHYQKCGQPKGVIRQAFQKVSFVVSREPLPCQDKTWGR